MEKRVSSSRGRRLPKQTQQSWTPNRTDEEVGSKEFLYRVIGVLFLRQTFKILSTVFFCSRDTLLAALQVADWFFQKSQTMKMENRGWVFEGLVLSFCPHGAKDAAVTNFSFFDQPRT
jgi:hypothetical protein